MFLCVVVGCVKWIDGSLWGTIIWFILAAVAGVKSFAAFSFAPLGDMAELDPAAPPESAMPPESGEAPESGVDEPSTSHNSTAPSGLSG
jgi:hypothetical protein